MWELNDFYECEFSIWLNINCQKCLKCLQLPKIGLENKVKKKESSNRQKRQLKVGRIGDEKQKFELSMYFLDLQQNRNSQICSIIYCLQKTYCVLGIDQIYKMNYLKVASIANLEVGKREIEKRFLADQSQANQKIKQNHMTNYNYNEAQQLVGVSSALIPDARKVKFGEGGENGKMQGRILEEQLKMKGLESEYDLERSRIEDANNAKTFRIRYPYGKENVRITEDVLEKYKGSQDQSSVLKKFQQEAKQLRQFKNSQKRLQYQAPFYRPVYNNTSQMISCNRGRRITSILEIEKKKLQQAKQEYMRSGTFKVNVVQKSKEREKEEARRMGKLEEMLKDVREKMDVNFSMILENQNQTERNRRFVRQVDLTRGRLQKIRAVDRLQATERNRLPVVVYKENKIKQQNFINRSLCLDLIDYERPTHIQKPEQFKKVLKIYNANKERLDQLCQRISVKSQDTNNPLIY